MPPCPAPEFHSYSLLSLRFCQKPSRAQAHSLASLGSHCREIRDESCSLNAEAGMCYSYYLVPEAFSALGTGQMSRAGGTIFTRHPTNPLLLRLCQCPLLCTGLPRLHGTFQAQCFLSRKPPGFLISVPCPRPCLPIPRSHSSCGTPDTSFYSQPRLTK